METQYRYFVRLAYNGTRYLGWQIQKQSPTVQETVNEALSVIFQTKINVVGCGRTDTGVHARDFFAHFDLEESLSEKRIAQTIKKLNGFLPRDIVIYEILPVKHDTNARFHALRRTYKYEVLTQKDPFRNDSAYAYFSKLDLKSMNTGAKILFDYFDFTSFSKVNTQVKTNNCKLFEAHWEKDEHLLIFTISADRFLRNMVRAIVGTLLDMGKGKVDEKELRQIIESKNRSKAGYSVPAQGLYLHKVEYPKDIFLKA